MKLYTGVVEDNLDPLRMGRIRVRVHGLHTDDRTLIPTDSLPWSQVMMPSTSASVSGIGNSPVGLLRGSWVVVFFTDPDEQYPIVLGSLPGLPVDVLNQPVADEELAFNFAVATDSSQAVPTTTSVDVTNSANSSKLVIPDVELKGARKASEFSGVTSDCINLIKNYESFRANSYGDDSNGYTIGYGTTVIDGKPVTAGMTISQQKAEALLLAHVNEVDVPRIKSMVRVLITQSMLDSLVCLSYNIGVTALSRSTLMSDINSERYLQAASRFLDWNKNNGKILAGLTKRRISEKDLFLKDGIPSATGQLEPIQNSTENVSVGSTGDRKYKTNSIVKTRGFTDPTGVYPLYYNEPDTNRLARNEKISETIVFKKEAARDMNVAAANGGFWSQSAVPYNAKYPNNHVFHSESGHVQEFDDTPGSRRVHLYHAAGTFTEIDDNGTRVNRIVGDGYEIYERHGYVHVKGAKHVNVEGAHTLKVGSTLDLEVSGATTINIFNNANLSVGGDFNLAVGGRINIQAAGEINIDSASTANINSNKDNIDVSIEVRSPEPTQFSELTVITRGEENAMQYESPEDGDPSAMIADRLQKGEITKEELQADSVKKESASVSANPVTPTTLNCDNTEQLTDFPPTLVLSPHFTLGKLNANGTRKLAPFNGLQAGDIACNLKLLCLNILEPIYNLYPSMTITSGFRRPGDVANSARNSDHYYGYAADIQFPGFNRKQYYDAALQLQKILPYDRIILEYNGSTTWLHISFKRNGNRAQVFTMSNHRKISDFGEFVLV